MKALDFLKEQQRRHKNMAESMNIVYFDDEIDEAIAGLEEAQETIKDLKHNYDVQVEFNNTAYKNYTNMVNSLEKRIAELEEAMKPKTCDGCVYENKDGVLHVECAFCLRNSSDNFKSKE